MFTGIYILAWVFLGLGLLIDGLCFILLMREVFGRRAPSGVPVVALICYWIAFSVRAATDLPWSLWYLLGLVLFHLVVHLKLPLALRKARP